MTHRDAPDETGGDRRDDRDDRRGELKDGRKPERIGLVEDVERREVRDERDRHDVSEEPAQPAVVEVDRELREERSAVGERVRGVAAVDRPEDDGDREHPDRDEDDRAYGYRRREHERARRRPLDVERDERVYEHQESLDDLAHAPDLEIRRDHLEERASRPHEHAVEGAVAHPLREPVELSDDEVGEGEAERGDRVEERDLRSRPTREGGTFAKMMRMTTKSRNVTKNMPTVSSAKD